MKTEQNNYYKNNMNETIKQIMLDPIEELELKLSSYYEHIERWKKDGDRLMPGACAINMWEHIRAWDKFKRNNDVNKMTTTEQNIDYESGAKKCTTKLNPLDEHNDNILRSYNRDVLRTFYGQKPIGSGLACPKCCSELYFDKPNVAYATYPPKRSVKCYKCEHTDYVYC